jgi:predicted nucleotidyltransferase
MATRMQALYRSVAKRFVEQSVQSAGQEIEAIVLYGSVARGKAGEESDIGLMIISPHVERIRDRLSQIRWELDLEYGTLTTLVYKTPAQLRRGLAEGDPFLRHVLEDGKALYDSGTYKRISAQALAAVG